MGTSTFSSRPPNNLFTEEIFPHPKMSFLDRGILLPSEPSHRILVLQMKAYTQGFRFRLQHDQTKHLGAQQDVVHWLGAEQVDWVKHGQLGRNKHPAMLTATKLEKNRVTLCLETILSSLFHFCLFSASRSALPVTESSTCSY